MAEDILGTRPPGLQLRRIRSYAASTAVVAVGTPGLIAGFATNGVPRYVIFVASVASGILGVLRALRLDFVLNEEGATVVNFWRTYRVAWREVERVRLVAVLRLLSGPPRIAISVRGRRAVLVQATPIGERACELAFEAIARLAGPDVPVGDDRSP